MVQKRNRNYSVVCTCVVCGMRFRASRTDAKYCKPACRKQASRKRGGKPLLPNMPDASQMDLNFLDALLDHLPYSVVACAYPNGGR